MKHNRPSLCVCVWMQPALQRRPCTPCSTLSAGARPWKEQLHNVSALPSVHTQHLTFIPWIGVLLFLLNLLSVSCLAGWESLGWQCSLGLQTRPSQHCVQTDGKKGNHHLLFGNNLSGSSFFFTFTNQHKMNMSSVPVSNKWKSEMCSVCLDHQFYFP